MEAPAPLFSGIVNNALFLSRPHINQTLDQSILIQYFCVDSVVDLLLNFAPDFVVNWIEVRTVRQPQIWKVLYV